MDDETMEVAPSAENGNVPFEDAPNEQSTEEATPATEEAAQPTESVEELFELPDGRKVDGVTLAKEWKENFLPDYTRKSQELAKNKQNETINNNETDEDNPYADPEYVPQSYEELLKVAEERAVNAFEAKQRNEVERVQAIENQVSQELATLKESDPDLNENALFMHASKFGFRDLNLAHQNLKYIQGLTKDIQQTTVKNIQKRADPVSTTNPGKSTGNIPNPSSFENAREYLRSLNK